MKAIIVGGGIGGLSAAIALRRANVLEAYDESAVIEIYTRALSSHRVRERSPILAQSRPCAAPKRSATYRCHSQFTYMRGVTFRILLAGRVQDMRFKLAGWQKLNLARRSRHFGGGWHS
ncbi:MAG TPA: hypothetical protein VE288_03115 [Rubrobacteraceae bacterium]|nr:hypothetical protein [Rubrobacteraceae bacterium]